jgi:predicted nucleotide-binding protein (sugar kinase/HSP70/actin superfamily)
MTEQSILTWPYFGYNDYLFQGLFQDLGVGNYTLPPLVTSKEIIDRGSFYSEEDACSPFKFVLGSFMDSLDRGANHILIGDGTGTCRFSLYGPLVKITLENMGYKFKYSAFDYHRPTRIIKCFKELSDGYSTLKTLSVLKKAWNKNRRLDEVKRLLTRYRAMEIEKGTSDRVAKQLWTRIMNAKNLNEINELTYEIPKVYQKEVEIDTTREYLRIAIIGEIYVVLVEESNYGVEKILNEMGVITDTNVSLRKFTDIGYKLNPFKKLPQKVAMKKASKSRLKHYCGGCGQENVGSLMMFHEQGFDGAFHLAPLPCMPEISGSYILEDLSEEMDFPILPIFADEHEYNAGLQTRIEAFVNCIKVWGKDRKEDRKNYVELQLVSQRK